jgi:hypothetical protein
MPFQPGVSGNPAGRPLGSRNRRTIEAEKLFDEEGEAVVKTALGLAKEGHPVAMRLCLDRVLPASRHRPVVFELPPLKEAADAITAMGKIAGGLATGELTANEAAGLSKVVQGFSLAVATTELEGRVKSLEQTTSRHCAVQARRKK